MAGMKGNSQDCIIERITLWIRPRIPLTSLNTVWRFLDKGVKTIIDFGCGTGVPMQYINRNKRFYVVGVDIFKPYLDKAWSSGVYNERILYDLRTLPTDDMKFDVVLCLEVLEHSPKEESIELLKKIERMASRQIIISMPVGKYIQHPVDGNPYQEHKCCWMPDEMKALGYKVRGVGLRGIGSATGISADAPRPLMPFFYALYIFAGLFVYFLPKFAEEMVCVKNLRGKDQLPSAKADGLSLPRKGRDDRHVDGCP